jgi:SHAQKYF class myb-like DNA-binding protein
MRENQSDFLSQLTSEDKVADSELDSLQNSNARESKNGQQGRWTEKEHQRFLEGLKLYDKDWRRIEKHIGTRTCSQIRSHA